MLGVSVSHKNLGKLLSRREIHLSLTELGVRGFSKLREIEFGAKVYYRPRCRKPTRETPTKNLLVTLLDSVVFFQFEIPTEVFGFTVGGS